MNRSGFHLEVIKLLTDNDVVNTAYIPLREGCGYIWGALMHTWTEKDQKAATREQTVKWGKQWIGHRVVDCSGLWTWIGDLYGYDIYHGSNTIWKQYCSDKGNIRAGAKANGEPLKPGCAVFLYNKQENNYHHIGVYVGNGLCIEAKGTLYGVVTSDISHWDCWGELKAVTYTGKVKVDMDSIRPGEKSDRVKQLQEDLNTIGFDCGKADGIYGKNTKKAVEKFQANYGLNVDGIAGPKTLAAIQEVLGGDTPSPEPVKPDISAQLLDIAQRLEQITNELRGLAK